VKVLFVHTLSNALPPPARPMAEWVEISFSISYLSAALKSAGHETSLVVLRREKYKKTLDPILREFQPALICYTAVTTEYPFVKKIARHLREEATGAYHVIGGVHGSVRPREVVAGPFDAVCIGEGEDALVELAAMLQAGARPRGIAGLWIKNSEAVEENPTRPFQLELDGIPFPDRNMWRPWIEHQTRHTVLLGRGCPFSCSYCSNHALKELANGRYVRFRSPSSVLDELRTLCDEFPATTFVYFEVETISADQEWALRLARRLEEFNGSRRTPLEFAINLRIVPGQRFLGLFEALKRAGFTHLRIGIESGSERVRKEILRRDESDEDLIASFADAREAGLVTYAYNLIGLPGETPGDFLETVALNRRCAPDRSYLSIFYPYPGTRLHEVCVERGIDVAPLEDSPERYRARLGLPEFPDRRVEYYFRRFSSLVHGKRQPLLNRLDDYVWQTVSGYPRLARWHRRLTGHGILSGALRGTRRLKSLIAAVFGRTVPEQK
jgi:anaerobic magnesium-protoporphyrin IX monomethyl ester cyclase